MNKRNKNKITIYSMPYRATTDTLQKPRAPVQEDEMRKGLKVPEQSEHGGETSQDKSEKGEPHAEAQKTVEELKRVLEKARGDLARKKGELKEFEMLFVGTFKGLVRGEKKANIQKEYDEFLKKYQEARAEYVVGDVSKLTEERMTLAEALVEAKGKGEEHFIVKGYKWLGDQNVSKLFGEKFGWKISDEFQKDHPLASGSLRIAGKFLSVRTAISMGLLGAGLMTGAGSGLALGLGIFGARAAMRGIGTASGSHDMLKLVGATTWENKGTFKIKKEEPWFKKIALWEKMTPEDIQKLDKEKIEERLANMEANALLHGKKVGESEVYKQFLKEYENKLGQEAEKNSETAASFIKDLSEASDKKRDELAHEKRIKHQVIVGVLTAAMVILPGISQLHKIIEKNALEWAAVTKKTGEFIGGQPAEAATLHDTVRDIRMVAGLQNKAVRFASEMSAHEKTPHPLSIEDLRHIRNIASRATEDGIDAKKLLRYIEKNNLIEQSGIHSVTLEGDHATVYGALQEIARKDPTYFKGITIDQQATELAKYYGVTTDQLKTLSHVGERLYFSKDGMIMTQERALIDQISVAHTVIVKDVQPHPTSGAVREHIAQHHDKHVVRPVHREIHHPRPTEEYKAVRSSVVDRIEPQSGQPGEPATHGEIVIERQTPKGVIIQENIRIRGSDVRTKMIEIQAEEVKELPGLPKDAHGEVLPGLPIEEVNGHEITPKLKLEIRAEPSGDTHTEVPTEALHISPAEIFAKGYDQTHIAEFAAAARANPDEFLKFYRATAQYDLFRYTPRLTIHDVRESIMDPKTGGANIRTLMEVAHDHKKPFNLRIGGVQKEFSLAQEVKSTPHIISEKPAKGILIETEEVPVVKPPVHETAPQPKLDIHAQPIAIELVKAPETSRAPMVEIAPDSIPDGKLPLNIDNYYGGNIKGSVQFTYDAQHHPIGYKTDAQVFGVGSSGELQNKFLYHGWGYDRGAAISEHVLTQGKHINTSLLQEQLEHFNKQLAFDMRLRDDLLANGHTEEAQVVLKGAKDILKRVREYGMDEQLIHKENLPPELM